jgi:hypothetical protein
VKFKHHWPWQDWIVRLTKNSGPLRSFLEVVPLHSFLEVVRQLRTAPTLDAFFLCVWFTGPFLYLIERSPADIWLTFISFGFLVHCARTKNWAWLSWNWVRAVGVFWGVMLAVSVISTNPPYALGEAVAWIRFPLYAVACAAWVGVKPARVTVMLILMGIASVIMMLSLGLEILAAGEPGGRLMGPYGDLVPGSFLGKAMMPLSMVLAAIGMVARPKKAVLAILGASLIVVFTLFTGERVNTGLACSAVFLAVVAHKINPKRICLSGSFAIIGLVGLSNLFYGVRDRIMLWTRPEVTHYFESDYWFSLRPGIVGFLENPLSGIGVGMHRLFCSEIGRGPAWLPGQNSCHTHPHQFYVQLAEETGIFGLIFGVIMIATIILSCWRSRKPGNIYANLAWIVPVLMFFPQPSADFFGQWNNLFLWFAVGLAMAMAQTSKVTEAAKTP